MLLLQRSYYIEHHIELSNLLNASFQNVMNEFFFVFIHTGVMTEEFGEVQFQKK